MCEVAGILSQFKSMAGVDPAAIADNLTRELLVIFLDSPEDRKAIKDIYEAGKCAAEVAVESGFIEGEEADGEDDGGANPADWDSFAADTEDIKEAGTKALACTDNVDRYSVGKISGRLFAKFFASELKA